MGRTGAVARPVPTVLADAPAVTADRRSASTLRHLIKDTDRVISRLTKERDRLTPELSAAGERGDHTELARVGARLAEVEAELGHAEERWLELSEEATA